MRTVFRIFLEGGRLRSTLVLLSLLAAATVEAIGIGALLPAAATVIGQSGETSGTSEWVRSIVGWAGIAPSFENLVFLIAAAVALKAIISFAALSYAAVAAAAIAVDFRERLINAVFNANWRFYADQHAGTFAAAVANDATRAAQAYLLAAQVLAALAQAVLLGGVALFLNWKLALASIAVGVAIAAAMNRLIQVSRAAGRKEADTTAKLTVTIVDLLANMKPLKAMHRFEPLLQPLHRTLVKLRRALITSEVAKQAFNLGNEVIVTLLITVIAYFAYTSWNVTLPELLVYAVIFFKINDIIAKVQKAVQQSVKFERSYTRIVELIGVAGSHRELNSGRGAPVLADACRFEDVAFSHAGAEVIRGITLEIPVGKVTVLQGPSGAGKTTIVDLLIGLYRPDRGRITIDGVPLREIDIYQWRRKIGYVPQELSLMHSDVRDNISFGDPAVSDETIWSALKQASADGFVASLPHGLDSTVGEMGGKISGGQRQRISLARALAAGPELLILDEVTSALDPATESEIVEKIAALRGRYTIVAITHRPAWTAIADRLYDVSGGTVRPAGAAARE